MRCHSPKAHISVKSWENDTLSASRVEYTMASLLKHYSDLSTHIVFLHKMPDQTSPQANKVSGIVSINGFIADI